MPNPKELIVTTAIVKQLTPGDLDEIVRVEKATWPKDWQAPREKFAARIEKFPQGVMGIFENGKLVGVTTSMLTNFNPKELLTYTKSWDKITGDGFITTHEPQGNALYVVSVGVQADARGKGYGQQLVASQVELARQLHCSVVFLGARIPKFREHFEAKSLKNFDLVTEAQQYLNLRRDDGKRLDPEIRFYERCGLQVAKLTDPNFGPDPESYNFGVIMYADIRSSTAPIVDA